MHSAKRDRNHRVEGHSADDNADRAAADQPSPSSPRHLGEMSQAGPGPDDRIFPVNRIATIVSALQEEGIPASQALESLHLSEAELHSPRTRVSQNQVVQCYRNALRLSTDRFFAFRAGLRFHISGYGIYGFAMLCGMNQRQSIRAALRYHAFAEPLVSIAFREEKEDASWAIAPIARPDVDAGLYRFIVENFFGIIFTVSSDVIGHSFRARAFHARYSPAVNPAEYARVFGCPVLFEQAENSFTFDRSWLENKPALADEVTHRELERLCDQLIHELWLHLGAAGEVRRTILRNLARPMRLDEVARQLNIAPRTLRRKLHAEGSSFQKVANELRMEIAIRYLRDTDLTLEDIAAAMGFSDAANFRQAFRRWTHLSPGEFRAEASPGG